MVQTISETTAIWLVLRTFQRSKPFAGSRFNSSKPQQPEMISIILVRLWVVMNLRKGPITAAQSSRLAWPATVHLTGILNAYFAELGQ
jgi:hypothetical protein